MSCFWELKENEFSGRDVGASGRAVHALDRFNALIVVHPEGFVKPLPCPLFIFVGDHACVGIDGCPILWFTLTGESETRRSQTCEAVTLSLKAWSNWGFQR